MVYVERVLRVKGEVPLDPGKTLNFIQETFSMLATEEIKIKTSFIFLSVLDYAMVKFYLKVTATNDTYLCTENMIDEIEQVPRMSDNRLFNHNVSTFNVLDF